MTRPKAHTALLVVAFAAIAGWMAILGGWLWWTFQPVTLTSIIQPIPILNDGRQIAIGDPIRMELAVDKPAGIRITQSLRFIECGSGNLVTLTAAERDLPPGRYTLVADTVILPAKVSPGDECRFTYRNTYAVNPIRVETVEFTSEPFTVLPAR